MKKKSDKIFFIYKKKFYISSNNGNISSYLSCVSRKMLFKNIIKGFKIEFEKFG